MAEKDISTAESTWLPVIGKALAYLCMRSAEAEGRFRTLVDRVDFLEDLGVPASDAAKAAGSSKASIDELRRRARNKEASSNGKAKSKSRRARRS